MLTLPIKITDPSHVRVRGIFLNDNNIIGIRRKIVKTVKKISEFS